MSSRKTMKRDSMTLQTINHHLITKMDLIFMQTKYLSKLKRKVSVLRVNQSTQNSGKARTTTIINTPLILTKLLPPSSLMIKKRKKEVIDGRETLKNKMMVKKMEKHLNQMKNYLMFQMIHLLIKRQKRVYQSYNLKLILVKKLLANCSSI